MAVKDWSLSALGNSSIDGINIAENCFVANLNDMGRAIMANVRGEIMDTAATVTAATLTTISGAAQYKPMSGNTTIDGFDTAVTGMARDIRVLGTPLLKYNATSMILPGSANIALAVNDLLRLRSLGAGNWIGKVDKADGLPIKTGVSGTFTPALTFGGASVGMTYSLREGNYYKIGNLVFFNLSINLSAKGSSTGQAIVTGLPFATSSSVTISPMVFKVGASMVGLTAGGGVLAYSDVSTSTVLLFLQTTTTQAAMADTNFNNSSYFTITGTYLT